MTLNGRLVAGSEVTELRGTIKTLIADGEIRILLDMANVHRIDSSGLGVLIEGHASVKAAGGALKLLNLSDKGMELLVLTRLSTLFEIYTDEQTAINSFFPDRESRQFDILEFVKNTENEKPESEAL